MTKDRTNILIAVIAVVVVAIIAVVLIFAFSGDNSTNEYTSLLASAEKSMDSGDYENAILSYRRAINEEPDDEDGYVGLSNVYIKNGDMELARITLTNGYTRTNGLKIYNMLLQNFPDELSAETPEHSLEGGTGKVDEDPELNLELMSIISTYTYGDYSDNDMITSSSYSDGVYTVSVTSQGMTLKFYNTDSDNYVINTNTNKPYAAKMPNEVTLTNIGLLLNTDAVTYEKLIPLNLNSLLLDEDEEYGWVICFTCDDCDVRIACDKDGTVSAYGGNQIIPPREPAELEEGNEYNLTGRVLSATTGSGISSVLMEFKSASLREPVTETTGPDGSYGVSLDAGTYTVTISCQDYITEDFTVTVNANNVKTENFTISPTVTEGEIRFVLEWGASPRDLDSYVFGTTRDGKTIRMNFSEKTIYADDGSILMQLDVDTRNGYGPETTTLYDMDGTYRFVVADYNVTGKISESGATVKIYVGDAAPMVVNITSGLKNAWEVCTIDHGVVTVTNTDPHMNSGYGPKAASIFGESEQFWQLASKKRIFAMASGK